MSNYPDDINNYNHDPRSPLYDDADERLAESMYEEALDDREELYYDMFDSQDSDDVVMLLRDFHKSQSIEAGNQLVAKLDEMLTAHIQSKIEDM